MIRLASTLLGACTLISVPFLATQEPVAKNQPCCQAKDGNPEVSLASMPTAGSPHLDEIKQLVGDWYELGEDGKPTKSLVSSYRVTAGGHAVIETLFPGSDHEMISIYHMDGGDLLLTHYCVLGNAPTYRAERSDKGFVWRCQGAHNLAKHGDAHMHEGYTHIAGKNRIQGTWLQTVDGEVSYEASFDLIRVAQAK